jgi:hypothetical protein
MNSHLFTLENFIFHHIIQQLLLILDVLTDESSRRERFKILIIQYFHFSILL